VTPTLSVAGLQVTVTCVCVFPPTATFPGTVGACVSAGGGVGCVGGGGGGVVVAGSTGVFMSAWIWAAVSGRS
jgi:hypothetical protein